MIDFEKLREAYQEATGYTIFMEEGELLDFYRQKNDIVMPICGTFKVNPVSLTAIQEPFIGIVTANVTLLAPPTEWETVRDKVNDVALVLNGTSERLEGTGGETYSVAYNCETCSVGDRILDVAVGVGEVFPITQVISYVIVEEGVSAYDARLWIDGHEVPILSLVENKVVASSVYADSRGTAGMAAETETYGIDFTTLYTTRSVSDMFRDAINGKALGIPHCVEIEKNGKKTAKIMQFGNVSDSISPPQNIGFNVSLVEVHPKSVDFNGYWGEVDTTKSFATFSPSRIIVAEPNIVRLVFFWGDGESTEWMPGGDHHVTHLYRDGAKKHTIRAFKMYDSDKTALENAAGQDGLHGAEITVKKDLNPDDYTKSEAGSLVVLKDLQAGGGSLYLIEDAFYLAFEDMTLIEFHYGIWKEGSTFPFPCEKFVTASQLNSQFKDSFLIGREYVKTALPTPHVEV